MSSAASSSSGGGSSSNNGPQQEKDKYGMVTLTVPFSSTNVIAVCMSMLSMPATEVSYQPIACDQCGSFLSLFSKYGRGWLSGPSWTCPFCPKVHKGPIPEPPKELVELGSLDYIVSRPEPGAAPDPSQSDLFNPDDLERDDISLIVAKNVHLRLLLPQMLTCNHQQAKCDACTAFTGANFVCMPVEKATVETDLTFYLDCVPTASYEDSACFQLQIKYTRLDGTQCIRVVNDRRGVTKKREAAEKTADIAVIALCGMQRSAELILRHDLDNARNTLISVMRLVKRASDVTYQEMRTMFADVEELDRIILRAKKDPAVLEEVAVMKVLNKAKNAPLAQFMEPMAMPSLSSMSSPSSSSTTTTTTSS